VTLMMMMIMMIYIPHCLIDDDNDDIHTSLSTVSSISNLEPAALSKERTLTLYQQHPHPLINTISIRYKLYLLFINIISRQTMFTKKL